MSIDLGFTPHFMPQPIPSTPCEAVVVAEVRGRNKSLGNKCGNKAKIIVNGKPCCLRHAQQLALDILIKEKLASHIGG